MKRTAMILSLLALPVLSGCLAAFDGRIAGENVLACSVAKDKLYGVSEWLDGKVNFGTRFRQADADAVCKPPAAATPAAPAAPASAASAAK